MSACCTLPISCSPDVKANPREDGKWRTTDLKLLFVLTLFCGVSLFGTVFARQSECSPLPDADFIENRLEFTVRSEGGEGTNPNVTLLQHHFSCIAVGSTEGTARSVSIAVRYKVTSTDHPEARQRISQLLFECSGSNYILSQSDPFEPNQNETLFNLATRRDCFLCAISSSSTIDTDTNCAGKSNILHLTTKWTNTMRETRMQPGSTFVLARGSVYHLPCVDANTECITRWCGYVRALYMLRESHTTTT